MGQVENSEGVNDGGHALAAVSVVVGLLAGAAMYWIAERWAPGADDKSLAYTAGAFVIYFAPVWLILFRWDNALRATMAAALIAGLVAFVSFFLIRTGENAVHYLDRFPIQFWFIVAGPLAVFLMTALLRASFETSAPPHYSALFFHGVTIPLIAGGASLFASLALLLLYAWAALLRSLDVEFFYNVIQEPLFVSLFLGGVGGLSVSMIRGQQAVLGALRFILLLFSRIAMPIMALFSLTFIIVVIANGIEPVFDRPYPSAIMIGLAFAAMLIFNGVYQNGRSAPPAIWLRLSTIITILSYPVFVGIAAYALWLRVGEYGLTPPRLAGLFVTGLAVVYSFVCVAGILSEMNWRARRWMRLVAPFNTLMVFIWIAALVGFASPLVDPWTISASSQKARLLEGRVKAEEFDYFYLRFRLGSAGESAVRELAEIDDHAEAEIIRTKAKEALEAETYFHRDGSPAPRPVEPPEAITDDPNDAPADTATEDET